MKIIIATNNQGKLVELKHALQPINNVLNQPFEWLSMRDLDIQSPVENQHTFMENALLKARHCSKLRGLPAIADDSGLCVPSLNYQPGIYSARYAGEEASDQENYQKLLQELGKSSMRKAFFYCTIAYVNDPLDPTPIIGNGIWHGEILSSPQGNNGFGYDPVFKGRDLTQSAALMTKEEKSLYSHRGQAITHFIAQWQRLFFCQ